MCTQATVYIYALRDPRTSAVRYVGKTNNPAKRLWWHLYDARRGRRATHKDHWVAGLLAEGLRPVLEVLEEVSVERWPQAEQRWIDHFDNLTNTALGGVGPVVPAPRSDIWRARIGAAHRGRKQPVAVVEATRRRERARHDSGCVHGHPWTEANTAYTPQGHRSCRTCRNEQGRAARRKVGHANARKTHCKHGHPLSGENLQIRHKESGRERVCRTCHSAAAKRSKQRRRVNGSHVHTDG